jgi:hypothetical protein
VQAKFAVLEAMHAYTFAVDNLVATGGLYSTTSPQFQRALDEVLASFCAEPEFRGWLNWFGGPLVANFTTLTQVSSFYTSFASTIIKNISNHIVTSEIVTLGNDGVHALYKAKLYHPCINAAYSDYAPPYPWSADFGIYGNTFLFLPLGGVCLQQFVSNGTFIELYTDPANPVIVLQSLSQI